MFAKVALEIDNLLGDFDKKSGDTEIELPVVVQIKECGSLRFLPYTSIVGKIDMCSIYLARNLLSKYGPLTGLFEIMD